MENPQRLRGNIYRDSTICLVLSAINSLEARYSSQQAQIETLTNTVADLKGRPQKRFMGVCVWVLLFAIISIGTLLHILVLGG